MYRKNQRTGTWQIGKRGPGGVRRLTSGGRPTFVEYDNLMALVTLFRTEFLGWRHGICFAQRAMFNHPHLVHFSGSPP